MEVLILGTAAAILQVLGYFAYGFKILRRDISPNAASWVMFAYGTSLLVVLEWDRDASIAVLMLPIACALSSIVVALYAVRKSGRAWWPEHPLERFSFFLDVSLTVAYATAWVLLANNMISPHAREAVTILILCCSIAVTFTAFFPLLRQVYHHPATEHGLPWIIWTLAYCFLFAVTFIEYGYSTELLLYPIVSVGIHGFIAVHTSLWRYKHHLNPV